MPLFKGFLEIVDAAGNITKVPIRHGASYFREVRVEHDLLNENDFEYAFVETEFLEPPRD